MVAQARLSLMGERLEVSGQRWCHAPLPHCDRDGVPLSARDVITRPMRLRSLSDAAVASTAANVLYVRIQSATAQYAPNVAVRYDDDPPHRSASLFHQSDAETCGPPANTIN